jgi:hypothetical protein
MGTWGSGPFDDDTASDWVWELQEANDWGVVETPRRAAADDPSVAVPDEVKEWLDRRRGDRPEAVRPLALSAVRRVLAAQSELVELWAEAGELDEWRSNVEKVASSLS